MERPSMLQVLKELERVRGGEGLTIDKAMELEHVPLVPAVDAELVRTKRHPDDRPILALDFVKCVARSHHLLGERWSKLVCMALNFDDERRTELLGDREAAYMRDIYVSKNTYARYRSKAFTLLAGELATLETSPCAPKPDGAQAEQARVLTASRIDPESNQMQVFVSGWVSVAVAPPGFENDTVQKMLNAVPGVVDWVREGEPEPLQLLKEIFRRVIEGEYPVWRAQLGLEESLLSVPVLLKTLEIFGERKDSISRMVAYAYPELNPHFLERDIPGYDDPLDFYHELEIPQLLDASGRDSVNSLQKRVLASYRQVFKILLIIEEAGAWSWIPRPEDSHVPVAAPLSLV